jgi:hypothetical protein
MQLRQAFDWTVEEIIAKYENELLRVIHTHHLYALRRQRPGTTKAEALSLSKSLKTFKYYGIVLSKILKAQGSLKIKVKKKQEASA